MCKYPSCQFWWCSLACHVICITSDISIVKRFLIFITQIKIGRIIHAHIRTYGFSFAHTHLLQLFIECIWDRPSAVQCNAVHECMSVFLMDFCTVCVCVCFRVDGTSFVTWCNWLCVVVSKLSLLSLSKKAKCVNQNEFVFFFFFGLR